MATRRLKPVFFVFIFMALAAGILFVSSTVLAQSDAPGSFPDGPLFYDDHPPADGAPRDYKAAAKWEHNPVTYSFLNCPANLDCAAAFNTVRYSIEEWDRVSGITLTEISSNGDIRIGWFTGDHGDGNSFDGPGNVLAHAFFPVPWIGDIAGDLHFDDSETWVLGQPSQPYEIHLGTVAMHELGHSIGLDHSNDPSALMWPEYYGVRGLGQDDINGAQALYGPPNEDDTGEAPPPPDDGNPPPPPPPSNITATTTTTVRFRSGPGTGYKSLGLIPNGTTVPVIGKNDTSLWYYVEYEGTRGWVASWLMLTHGDPNQIPVINDDGSGAPEPPPPGDPGTPGDPGGGPPSPTGVNAYTLSNLRLRKGPGTGYPALTLIPDKVTVPVLGKNDSGLWIYVEWEGLKGWIAAWLVEIQGDINKVPVLNDDGTTAGLINPFDQEMAMALNGLKAALALG